MKKEDGTIETVTVYRKVKSVHRRLKKDILKAVQAGKPHRVKKDDISWTLEFEKPLPDGTKSTSSKNVKLVKRPVKKGWERIL